MTLEPRPVPPVPRQSWSALDRSLSLKLFRGLGQKIPRRYLMALEHGGNGLVWLFAAFAMLLVPSITSAGRTALANFLVAFAVDLVLVGTLKSLFRRPRPVYNASGDFILVVSVDKFSFPSGHASRCVHTAACLACPYSLRAPVSLHYLVKHRCTCF